MQINSDLLKNLTLKKGNLYKKLCIPLKKISQSSNSKFEDLKMKFPSSRKKIENNSYVSPHFNAYQVIFQKVRKIDGTFAVLTVKKNSLFDYWGVFFDVPTTARTMICRIFKSDLINLSQNFFDGTYPIQMSELKRIFEKDHEVNYHKFSVKYERLLDKNKTYTRPTSIYFEPDSDLLKEKKVIKNSKFSQKKYLSFIEAKVIFIYCFFL